MLLLVFRDHADAARCSEALLGEADRVEAAAPLLARRYREIADQIGDELDGLPVPSGWAARVRARSD